MQRRWRRRLYKRIRSNVGVTADPASSVANWVCAARREKPDKKVRELVDAERADASAGPAERPTAQPREDTRAPISRVEERRRPAPMEPVEERRRPAAGRDSGEGAALGRERAPREGRSSSQMPMDKPSRRDREPPAERRERAVRRPDNAGGI